MMDPNLMLYNSISDFENDNASVRFARHNRTERL